MQSWDKKSLQRAGIMLHILGFITSHFCKKKKVASSILVYKQKQISKFTNFCKKKRAKTLQHWLHCTNNLCWNGISIAFQLPNKHIEKKEEIKGLKNVSFNKTTNIVCAEWTHLPASKYEITKNK